MNEKEVFTQVRRATAADAAAISALLADVHELHVAAHPHIFKSYSFETFPPATVQTLMADTKHIFLLAEEAEAAVGYLYAELSHRAETPFTYGYDEIYVHQIAVKPQFQRRGHGERLIAAAKSLMRTHGIPMLTLNTWAFNAHAQAFFMKQGFEPMMHRLWMRDDVALAERSHAP